MQSVFQKSLHAFSINFIIIVLKLMKTLLAIRRKTSIFM